jgi:hypothetical protein
MGRNKKRSKTRPNVAGWQRKRRKSEKKPEQRRRFRDVISVKKPLAFLFLIVFCLLLIFVLGTFFADVFTNFPNQNPTCGDGSFYDTCSLTKPYFCEQGLLVKKASLCGCVKGFTKKGDSCISDYHEKPKNISLDYILNGQKSKIDFIIYEEMAHYLFELPRALLYKGGEKPSRVDFKLKDINEEIQREFLLPLVVDIQNRAKNKQDQMRIAVGLVQSIPFGASKEIINISQDYSVNYSRYSYEVIYDKEGVCGEKSKLLAFLLRELGYGVVVFYHQLENHESIGIKCPVRYSLGQSGYCFVETSGPAIISDDELDYVRGIKLRSSPEIMLISEGLSLGDDLREYDDAEQFQAIRESLKDRRLSSEEKDTYEQLIERYGLEEVYEV